MPLDAAPPTTPTTPDGPELACRDGNPASWTARPPSAAPTGSARRRAKSTRIIVSAAVIIGAVSGYAAIDLWAPASRSSAVASVQSGPVAAGPGDHDHAASPSPSPSGETVSASPPAPPVAGHDGTGHDAPAEDHSTHDGDHGDTGADGGHGSGDSHGEQAGHGQAAPVSRPRAFVLSLFAGVNLALLAGALFLRYRNGGPGRPRTSRPSTPATQTA